MDVESSSRESKGLPRKTAIIRKETKLTNQPTKSHRESCNSPSDETDHLSLSSDDGESTLDDNFRRPSYYDRKEKKEKNRRARFLNYRSSNGWRNNNKQNEQIKDIFIRHVPKSVDHRTIRDDLESYGISVCELMKVSHRDARSQSIRLRVPLKHYEFLMDAGCDFWPEHVKIEEFKVRKNGWRNRSE